MSGVWAHRSFAVAAAIGGLGLVAAALARAGVGAGDAVGSAGGIARIVTLLPLALALAALGWGSVGRRDDARPGSRKPGCRPPEDGR